MTTGIGSTTETQSEGFLTETTSLENQKNKVMQGRSSSLVQKHLMNSNNSTKPPQQLEGRTSKIKESYGVVMKELENIDFTKNFQRVRSSSESHPKENQKVVGVSPKKKGSLFNLLSRGSKGRKSDEILREKEEKVQKHLSDDHKQLQKNAIPESLTLATDRFDNGKYREACCLANVVLELVEKEYRHTASQDELEKDPNYLSARKIHNKSKKILEIEGNWNKEKHQEVIQSITEEFLGECTSQKRFYFINLKALSYLFISENNQAIVLINATLKSCGEELLQNLQFRSSLYATLACAYFNLFASNEGKNPTEEDIELGRNAITKGYQEAGIDSQTRGLFHCANAYLHSLEKEYNFASEQLKKGFEQNAQMSKSFLKERLKETLENLQTRLNQMQSN